MRRWKGEVNHKDQRAIITMEGYQRLPSFASKSSAQATPSQREELSDLFGDEALDPPLSPQMSSMNARAEENHSDSSNEGALNVVESQGSNLQDEKLFILCFGCVQVLMVRTKYRHSSLAPLISPGTSTLILSSCRKCTRQRSARASLQPASPMQLQNLFRTLRISPYVIQQMHSYKIMKAVAGNSVLILTHDGGVAYEPWETIFEKIPEDCEVYGISTDVSKGPEAHGTLTSFVPASFM